MLIAVTGGAGSGKSAFAESCVQRLPGRRIYLATMRPSPGEGERRILRHRALRAGKGFETIEKARYLQTIDREILSGSVVLLEDLSNLSANAFFPEEGDQEKIQKTLRIPEDPLQEVSSGIRYLEECADHLVLVMNEVFSDGIHYGEETERYRKA